MLSAEWRPFCLGLNVLSAGPPYIRNPNLVISVSPDVLVRPDGDRQLAGTEHTEELDTYSFEFNWISMIQWRFYGPVTSSRMATEIPQNRTSIVNGPPLWDIFLRRSVQTVSAK